MSIEEIANDVTDFRLYTTAIATLQLYDYCLTLQDEIQCVWKGRNWVYFLFLFNRYVPIIYQAWSLFATFWPGYTQEMCNHSAFIHTLVCVVFTLVVQVVLTLRVYAVMLKHRLITGVFVGAAALQFGLGAFMTYMAVKRPAHPVLEVDFSEGHICVYGENRREEIAYTAFSLLFDLGAFLVIMIRLLWRRPSSLRIPSFMQTIIKDVTLYVLLLCTCRIIFVFLAVFTADQRYLTRLPGSTVFVSIMTSRMLLSLKRTSTGDLYRDWGVEENTEGILDPPSSPRIIHGGPRFSNSTSRTQAGTPIPIPMEVIHIRDERYHV